MIVLISSDQELYSPLYEYYDGKKLPHAEKPSRIIKILEGCERAGLRAKTINRTVGKEELLPVHSLHYLAYLRDKCADIHSNDQIIPSVFIRDTYTPLTRHTYQAALKSAGLAVEAAEEIINGERVVYALCRPPGHHAEVDGMAGYCYINNAALAANALAKRGKVAILDIDYHHGNGTQQIFYERKDVYYFSVHAEPEHAFPYATGFADEIGAGEGEGFNSNFPVALESTVEEYLKVLKEVVQSINSYNPDFVVLSLGYDTYENDPIGGLCLDEDSFWQVGSLLAKQLAHPTLIIQEGGYHVDKLADLSESFLRGFLSQNS